MKTTTLILADDHSMFRQGIISLLKEYDTVSVIGEAANGEELLHLMKTVRADIVLLDLQMPLMNGAKALSQIRKLYPAQKVIILSMDFNRALLQQYLSGGLAQGFIPKNGDIEVLLDALRLTMETGNCFDISWQLVKELGNEYKNEFHLTAREIEVLKFCSKGLSNAAIAECMGVSERTVEFHKTHIFAKTGLKNQQELMSYGVEHKLHL